MVLAGRGNHGERLIGPPGGPPSLPALIEAMREQTVYVEIDTADSPNGEIRGQVHADRRRPGDISTR